MNDNMHDIAKALASTTQDVAEGALPPTDEVGVPLRKVFIRTWVKRVKADNNITTAKLADTLGCSTGYITNELLPVNGVCPKVDTFVGYVRKVSNLPVYKHNRDKYVQQICQQYFDLMMRDNERENNENLVP